MLQKILDSTGFSLARTALGGLSRRQDAIASNIANVDTPGYGRREVTFEDALRQSIGAGGGRLTTTDPRHLTRAGASASSLDGGGRPRDVVSMRNDANDVSVDEEMLLMVETQIRYQALTQGVGQRLNTLRTVIRGG